jgi:hypothetical protein
LIRSAIILVVICVVEDDHIRIAKQRGRGATAMAIAPRREEEQKKERKNSPENEMIAPQKLFSSTPERAQKVVILRDIASPFLIA